MTNKPGFALTRFPSQSRPTGFAITFANGYSLSVQIGRTHYCSNRDFNVDNRNDPVDGCADAEVAVIRPDGDFAPLPDGDHVMGWQTPDQVIALAHRVMKGEIA